MPYSEIRRIVSDGPSHPVKVIAPIVAVVLCFCAICVHVLIEARRAAWDRAGDAAASLVAAIESDLVRNVETLDLSLKAVVDNLRHPELGGISPELRQLVLFDRAATARHLGAILVLDETGQLRFDSRTVSPKPIDLSDRDYFNVHKEKDSAVLYVGQPQAARGSGSFVVGISRRLSHPDGSFAGVVAGTLRLSYFKQLFKDTAIGPNGNITLSRTDGTILMRWPFDEAIIGRNIRHAEVFKRLAQARSGRFESNAATDGVRRQFVYTRIGELPIVLGVGQATDDIYAQWRQYAWTVGLLIAALCAVSSMLALFLLRDLRRRNDAQSKLATLASTDGLTGLSNRWHFDETIRREWRRARRARAPLALLMIDADLFKAYNDRRGHQAGDRLLKTIAAAISGSIRRGTDLGARYGGDEFTVLLPETSLAGAARVAGQIRAQFAAGCREHGADDDARISVGVACLVPDRSAGYAALLAAADGALYRAKGGGRDRTELAEAEFLASQQTARPSLHRAA